MGSVNWLMLLGARFGADGLRLALTLVAERHSKLPQESLGLGVSRRAGADGDVEADAPLDLVEFDLRENALIFHAQRIIAISIKSSRRYAAEVPNAGQCHFDQSLEELIHALATKCHLRADRLVLSK